MTDTASTATTTYGEGVKWILAIAAAAIGGAFLHLKEIKEETIWVQALLSLSLAAFVYSIWTGMYYLLWLNTVPLARDRIKAHQEELATVPETNTAKRAEIEGRIGQQQGTIKLSETTMPSWYRQYTYSFSSALVSATLALILSLALSIIHKHPAKNDRAQQGATNHETPVSHPHYSLVSSAVHRTAKGREAHTFLINDETGDLWQMMCDRDGRVILQKVTRIDTVVSK